MNALLCEIFSISVYLISVTKKNNSRRFLSRTLQFLMLCILPSTSLHAAKNVSSDMNPHQVKQYRQWIAEMKQQPRGPFKQLRWFCNDGSVLAPKAYACAQRGGGRQHGQWNEKTTELRKEGFLFANVLAATNEETIANDYSPLNELTAILLEQFLIDIDDGWILREARFYRGAFQVEAEQQSAINIIKHLTASDQPIENRFMLILEAIKRLPSANTNQQLLTTIRTSATSIQKDNPSFISYRNKIHGRLEASDAVRLRDFVNDTKNKHLNRTKDILTLADNIDLLFAPSQTEALLNDIVSLKDQQLTHLVRQWQQTKEPIKRYSITGKMLPLLRDLIERNNKYRQHRFGLLAQLEQLAFVSGREILESNLNLINRQQLLSLLSSTQDILYGIGLLTHIEREQANNLIKTTLAPNNNASPFVLKNYQQLLRDLARIPVWAERRIQFFFQEQVNKFSTVEPLAHNFIPDRLRGSPLLIYTNILKVLDDDAAKLSGIQHHYFGDDISSGFRVLNPGVATGELHTPETLAALKLPPSDVILVVPETLADLPAVTGLLTAFEGNQLSHVQLLARNLGVPNIVISQDLLKRLSEYQGRKVELLASEGGVVSIRLMNQNTITGQDTPSDIHKESNNVLINIDESKLDLTQKNALSIQQLTAASSGVTVGPKAAKVAQLAKQFPGQVSPGLALPFGGFRQLLDSNRHSSGLSMFDWIKSNYARLDQLGGNEKANFRQNFLQELRSWFLTVELDNAFITDLKQKMTSEFGEDGSYGVFVRSDTNVEDLAGFTGAGLNLTVPHVVGFDNILAAIRRVWASPFTERAFGWRQARMNKPEHVYTAILLHKSVPADKSGVLVTTDIFNGQDHQLSVVLNEGVAGGVDGLSAESVRIDRTTGRIEYIASATSPYKRILLEGGGSQLVPASGSALQLSRNNINDLIDFSNNVGQWFSDTPDAVADVEFGFYKEQFILFQIRPLVDSPIGKRDPRLLEMDKALNKNSTQRIHLNEALRI